MMITETYTKMTRTLLWTTGRRENLKEEWMIKERIHSRRDSCKDRSSSTLGEEMRKIVCNKKSVI